MIFGKQLLMWAALSIVSVGSADALDGAVLTRTSSGQMYQDDVSPQPLVNPLPAPSESSIVAEPASTLHRPGVKRGSPPRGMLANTSRQGVTGGRAYGSFGIPYTATRVEHFPVLDLPGGARNLLSTSYPYSAIGELTFDTPSGRRQCTASLILRSLILTAAHCVQNFGTPPLFMNFEFRPGHYGPPGATAAEKAPFGVWTTLATIRSDTWANGTDPGSGAARDNDLAILVVAKKAGEFIGDSTGWLAYGWNNPSFISSPRTGNLAVAATTTLGYPRLLDGGNIMQRVDGPTFRKTINNAFQLWQGSNFTAGSDGGPWIVNFTAVDPVLSGGAVDGSAPGLAVVGVTSWQSNATNGPKSNYSSQFRQNSRFPNADYDGYGGGNIGALISFACRRQAGGGQTFAQAGYCD